MVNEVSGVLTGGMPIILRNIPDPRYIAKASNKPIPAAKTKAVETEDSDFLSAISSSGWRWPVHQTTSSLD